MKSPSGYRRIVALVLVALSLFSGLQAYRQHSISERVLADIGRFAAVGPRLAQEIEGIQREYLLWQVFYGGLALALFVGAILVWSRAKRSASRTLPEGTDGITPKRKPSRRTLALGAGAVLVSLAAIAVWVVTRNEDHTALVEAVQADIRERSFDPDSVRFRNVRVDSMNYPTFVVCGEVNAKNRLGGYIGYVPFVFDGPETRTVKLVSDDEYQRWCRRAK